MLTVIEAVLLGIIQGLTEWLPVSSSGHLVIAQEVLGLIPPLIFDVMLHVGTLFVVLVVFWTDVVKILKAVVKLDFKSVEGKMALFIALGSVPTALIGFFFHDLFAAAFTNLLVVGAALLVTGCILFASERKVGNKKLTAADSLLVGIVQGISITPGISRSGITISTALLRGVKKETAAKFSFLLFIPAVVGATVYEAKDLVVGSVDLVAVGIGTIVAAVVGYLSLKFLLRLVFERKFHLFAYYCWVVGISIITFSLL